MAASESRRLEFVADGLPLFGRAQLAIDTTVVSALHVVFGVEVGGRWSRESQDFISQLARARARQEQPLLRRRAEQAWRFRWGSMVSCVVARAVADSLLGLPRALGADGVTPLAQDVERDLLAAGFCLVTRSHNFD